MLYATDQFLIYMFTLVKFLALAIIGGFVYWFPYSLSFYYFFKFFDFNNIFFKFFILITFYFISFHFILVFLFFSPFSSELCG